MFLSLTAMCLENSFCSWPRFEHLMTGQGISHQHSLDIGIFYALRVSSYLIRVSPSNKFVQMSNRYREWPFTAYTRVYANGLFTWNSHSVVLTAITRRIVVRIDIFLILIHKFPRSHLEHVIEVTLPAVWTYFINIFDIAVWTKV